MQSEAISVIIVNYNGGDHVLECIRSLQRQTYQDHRVIVVDNQSADGSVDDIRTHFPKVTIIENNANLGWGIGCNVGIEAGISQYVALVNNDAYLEENCLAEMIKAIEIRQDYGACASKILLWDQPDKIEVAGLVIVRDGSSIGRGRLQPAKSYDKIEEVFCANDCCCLYRREMLDKIGLYDPDFFLYADETDMGWRHQLAGWKCIYTPRAIAYHAHSKSAGSYSDLKGYLVERNRIYLCLKYFPVRKLITSFSYAIFRYLYQLSFSNKGQGALARYREHSSLCRGLIILIKAHFDALRKAPVMLRRRWTYRRRYHWTHKQVEDLIKKYSVTIREAAFYE